MSSSAEGANALTEEITAGSAVMADLASSLNQASTSLTIWHRAAQPSPIRVTARDGDSQSVRSRHGRAERKLPLDGTKQLTTSSGGR